MNEMSPIPAATVVLMRSGAQGPELLMLERTAHMAFAAGALVFPGGRVEPDDRDIAARLSAGLDHGAARIAGIRETIEEVGIPIGFRSSVADDLVLELRRELKAQVPFSVLLDRHRLELNPAALTPFARWTPGWKVVRTFDAVFLLARAEDNSALPPHDEHEAIRTFWASARQVLADAAEGNARLIFPTRRNLERLAQFSSFEEAVADAGRYPVQRISAWTEIREGRLWTCIPQGLGYPVTEEPVPAGSCGQFDV